MYQKLNGKKIKYYYSKNASTVVHTLQSTLFIFAIFKFDSKSEFQNSCKTTVSLKKHSTALRVRIPEHLEYKVRNKPSKFDMVIVESSEPQAKMSLGAKAPQEIRL